MPHGRFAARAHGRLCPTVPAFEIVLRSGQRLLDPLSEEGVYAVLAAPIGTPAIFCGAQPQCRLRGLRAKGQRPDPLQPQGLPIRHRRAAGLFSCGAADAGFAAGRLQPPRLRKLRAAGSLGRSVDWEVRGHRPQAILSRSPARSRRPPAVQSCVGVSAAGAAAAFPLAFAQSAVHRAAGPAAGLAEPAVQGPRTPAGRVPRWAPRRSPCPASACRRCQASPIFPHALSRCRRGS
jgi:hypothetical protein